jgi:uracil-DNA glycosylase
MTYWNADELDFEDPLNRKIWDQSPSLQLQIDPPDNLQLPGSVGAQQAMTGATPLPWVPDIVGRRVSEGKGIAILGSAYAGFIRGLSKRGNTITEHHYRNTTMAEFQRAFLRHVVTEDPSYYRKIERSLSSVLPLDRVCLFDLCRVSFVQRASGTNANRKDDSGDRVVRADPAKFVSYVENETAEAWTWARIADSRPQIVVALGTIAEHGVLRLFARRSATIARTKNAADTWRSNAADTDRWPLRYADDRFKLDHWVRERDSWFVQHPDLGSINVLPVYHPAASQFRPETIRDLLRECLR